MRAPAIQIVSAFLILIAPIGAPRAAAAFIYVDPDATGANDGSSWDDAFRFLQDGLVTAAPGDQVRVAAGTYRPDRSTAHPDGTGDREATFELRSGVALLGCYAGAGAIDPDARSRLLHPSVLSGDLAADDQPGGGTEENAYHVLSGAGADQDALCEDFTITAGNADGAYQHRYGGGLYGDTNATLRDCRFQDNRAIHGGGVYLRPAGGFVTYPVLERCSVIGNSAQLDGGGMLISDSGPTMSHCLLACNVAGRDGGGQMYDMDGFPEMTNCVVSGNRAGRKGGGAYLFFCFNFPLTNCTFADNRAGTTGGAFYITNSSEQIRLNSTIVWGNLPNAISAESAEPSAVFSDIEGGWPGTGNIDADPLLRSASAIPWLLGPTSPCVDSGDPALTDAVYDTHPRWPAGFADGPRCDIGATGGPRNWEWRLCYPPTSHTSIRSTESESFSRPCVQPRRLTIKSPLATE